ncbi:MULTISPECIES: hypothetical protein [Sphingomonadales]|jgi:hypothetical protein|uniref:Uncharacterized protein n=2 Tax=Sphingomonadaceae TaxID=41297 RepID=A0A397PAB1_9SPHN|nr:MULTISPECIES: hypothetical protein [Sphingomonadaceae]EKU73360.1 hypothetical protein HMPREF9718_03829 [Sphingobium yanoikuyae ATCC 51230]RIA46012.1 hypothetical protein DFR49_0541 [Hephaestia caeni]WQE08144.1 hypothetical protein U0025_04455 [Sphingobium yanoikuyae]
MTKRSGLSEPSRVANNALRLGTIIKIGIVGDGDARMMISAIFTREDCEDDSLYLLLTAHSHLLPSAEEVSCTLIRGPGKQRLALGAMVPPDRVLGPESSKLGFHVLRLDATPLFEKPRETAKPLATVRNFREGIWSDGLFHVRRLNDPTWTDPDFRDDVGGGSSRTNRQLSRPVINRKGRVAGDLDEVRIPDLGTTLSYSYCGLVTRGRNRPLAEPQALGAPVISESGALSAIIVGAADQETLVFPVEELRRGRPIEFVTLGEDWPKVKIASSTRSVNNSS